MIFYLQQNSPLFSILWLNISYKLNSCCICCKKCHTDVQIMYSENLQAVPILFINKCNKKCGWLQGYWNNSELQNIFTSISQQIFSVVAKKITLKGIKFLKHQFSTSSVHILDFVLLYAVLGDEKMLNIYFGDNV